MATSRLDQSGSVQAEFAAVMVVGLPLLFLLVFISLETARFYSIKSAMEVAARDAARSLVVKYNTTGSELTTVDWLTMSHFVAGSSQFTVSWDSASPPAYVTVTCTYPTAGGNGLDPFPAGPLRYLGSHASFNMSGIVVQGTFTLPIQ